MSLLWFPPIWGCSVLCVFSKSSIYLELEIQCCVEVKAFIPPQAKTASSEASTCT